MAQGGFDPLNQRSPSYTSGTDISWYQTGYMAGDTVAGQWQGYTGGYPVSPPKVGVGSWMGVDIQISRNEENRMVRQDMWLFKMVAVDNVEYEVLAEGVVFARSENSANIKFALANKINPDSIGDTVDFFIAYKSQLREPLDESKVQKVQVVE